MKTTRWTVAACVLGVVVVLVLAACGGEGPAAGTAQAIYLDLGCADCHGLDREGLRSGPPLLDLSERWQADELLAYLRDPESFVKSNPRLSYLAERYPIAMPAYPNTPEEDLRAVVDLIMGG